jgi:hypothetical protein
MRNRQSLVVRILVLSLALVLSDLPLSGSPAAAQQLIGRCHGLLGCLFGGGGSQPPARVYVPPQKRTTTAPRIRRQAAPQPQRNRAPSRSSSHHSAPAAPPPPPEVDKLDNARTVLVVGDFLAGGLAEGLEDAYAESPGVRVVDRSNGSSGFVRSDYYDWNAEIGQILEEEKPYVVVMMIGSNDRQQIVVDGNRVDPRSDPWRKEYLKRIGTFAKAVTSRKLPLVWVGLPSFKSPSMTSDVLAFNDLYKQEVEAAGGEFVDIWDGFVDENGNFIFTGPDMNGQPVRLRGSDGINLTQAGKRKVAFYVEKPLNKILGAAVSPDVNGAAMEQLPEPSLVPVLPGEVDRTQPVSLLGPDLDGGSALLGPAANPRKSAEPDRNGMNIDPPAGRADNFSTAPAPRPVQPADRRTTGSTAP